MNFAIWTTISGTSFRSELKCGEVSASRCIRQWVHLARRATLCTNARNPLKQPDIARAPSVHKPTKYVQSTLSSSKKLFRIANKSCALQLNKMGLQKSKSSTMPPFLSMNGA